MLRDVMPINRLLLVAGIEPERVRQSERTIPIGSINHFKQLLLYVISFAIICHHSNFIIKENSYIQAFYLIICGCPFFPLFYFCDYFIISIPIRVVRKSQSCRVEK